MTAVAVALQHSLGLFHAFAGMKLKAENAFLELTAVDDAKVLNVDILICQKIDNLRKSMRTIGNRDMQNK
jgi:hypothetical protein